MIIFPKNYKIIYDLNSYYTIIPKLIEHYQGILNSGCIYFKSPASDGVIFFDDENIINGTVLDKNKIINGQSAIDLLLEVSEFKNYSISVYEISQDVITFWANLNDNRILKNDYLINFKDLEELFKVYKNEKLTGFFDIKRNEREHYLFFFLNGHVIYSTSKKLKYELKEDLSALENLKENYAYDDDKNDLSFSVKSIPLDQKLFTIATTNINESESEKIIKIELRHLEMVQSLMLLFEKYFIGIKKNKDLFYLLLKKKFLEKVDKYEFLDPFSAEFTFSDGVISFVGKEKHDIVANSVIECLKEISDENKMSNWLKKHLVAFQEKYKHELESLKTRII